METTILTTDGQANRALRVVDEVRFRLGSKKERAAIAKALGLNRRISRRQIERAFGVNNPRRRPK